jgi:hypothetical protein
MTVLRTARTRAVCGDGGDGCEEPISQLHKFIERKVSEERSNNLEWRRRAGFGSHQAGGFGFRGRGFLTRDRCFLGLPSSRLRGHWSFKVRLVRPGRLTAGGHFSSLGGLRVRLGRFLRSRVRSGCLDSTPTSDNFVPPLAQVYRGTGPGPLLVRSGRVGYGGDSSATVKRLLCKRVLSFFPLHTAPVVRRVVSPAATAQGLFPRSRAATGEVGAPTRDAPDCVTAVSLRMSKALAALA